MSNTARCLVTLASLASIAACGDRPSTSAPPNPEPAAGPAAVAAAPAAPGAVQARAEALARRLALALADSAFRAYLKDQLDRSPIREHKLHFQRFLAADRGRALATVAGRSHAAAQDVQAEARAAIELELYLPVPAHRAGWRGGPDVLVATALGDHDAPVAFDPQGNRRLLRADRPPATPVIALVPVETDFSPKPAGMVACDEACMSDGGGGGGGGSSTPPTPGLYMTKAHFVGDFEGWLKGSPELEVHILGQQGQTDSLSDYQCAGEHQPPPYYFDQNDLDWSGSVLLFSGTQIANYNAAHPNQNVRVFFVEDDDTPCVIKADKHLLEDLLKTVDSTYTALTAGNDSSTVYEKFFRRARAFAKLWAAVASFINTNDELIGNAVEDDVVGVSYPGYNWIVKGQNGATNGWVDLEMK